jgi:hypothetical protein
MIHEEEMIKTKRRVLNVTVCIFILPIQNLKAAPRLRIAAVFPFAKTVAEYLKRKVWIASHLWGSQWT